MTIKQFERASPYEDACCAYLIRQRWPTGVWCPRCGSAVVYELKTMKYKWECPDRREGGAYRFSHLVGTVFENTGSYETAWSMCHRIRVALRDEEFKQLVGIVEVDETFIGGKPENRHKNKRGGGRGKPGDGVGSGKTPIVGAIQRRGNVVAKVISRISAKVLNSFVREAVLLLIPLRFAALHVESNSRKFLGLILDNDVAVMGVWAAGAAGQHGCGEGHERV